MASQGESISDTYRPLTREEIDAAVRAAVDELIEKCAKGDWAALIQAESDGLPVDLRGEAFKVRVANLREIIEKSSLQDA